MSARLISIPMSEYDRLNTIVATADAVIDYAMHRDECIRSQSEAGEPTSDGGYRTKFAGKWYQSRPVNKEPKCNCGLDDALAGYEKASGLK